MKVIAKKWFFEETTNANYDKGDVFEVKDEVAKELIGKDLVEGEKKEEKKTVKKKEVE